MPEPDRDNDMTCAGRVEISVIIPAFNAEDFILAALASLINQDFQAWEAIVVNDGSSDRTPDVLATITDPRVRVVSIDHKGVSAARNLGLRICCGRFVYFLDADDLLAAGALSRCYAVLIRENHLVAAYGEVVAFSNGQDPVGKKAVTPIFSVRPNGDILRELVSRNFIASGCLVRKAAVECTNGFSRDLAIGEDWALWVELACLGEFRYLPAPPLMYYRQHRKSTIRTSVEDESAMQPAIDYVYSLPALHERFSEQELQKLKLSSEFSAMLYAIRELLKRREWCAVRGACWRAVKMRPLDAQAWVFMACAATCYVPGFVKSRLK